MNNKEAKYEDGNKIISEFIKLNCEAKKFRKNKKYQLALEYYIKCYNLINDTDFIEKKCKTHFRLGHCYLKIKQIEESYSHFSQCNRMISKINEKSFPYSKVKGQLSAYMILLKYAIEDSTSALGYTKEFISLSEGMHSLEEKLTIFYYFIKELFTLINQSKRVESFLDCYQSCKNEIMFNNQKSLCSSLKTSFQTMMNNSIKQILFEKITIIFYNVKYDYEDNHPLIEFLEKNNDIIKESNVTKAKGCLDLFLKNQKIKLPISSNECIQERKNQIEGFNELYSLLAKSFNVIFKNSFSLVNMKNNDQELFVPTQNNNNIKK